MSRFTIPRSLFLRSRKSFSRSKYPMISVFALIFLLRCNPLFASIPQPRKWYLFLISRPTRGHCPLSALRIRAILPLTAFLCSKRYCLRVGSLCIVWRSYFRFDYVFNTSVSSFKFYHVAHFQYAANNTLSQSFLHCL